MSTIIIALFIIVSSIGIPLIFIFLNKKKQKKQREILLRLLSQEGTNHGLSFSGKEVLKNKIMGFDGLKQTLLFFEFENRSNVICINMADIENCTVEKKYDSIVIGTEKRPKTEPHLRSIDLIFAFKNRREPVSLSFYDSIVDSIYEMAELEARAKTWQMVFSKMIFKEIEVSA